MGITVHNYDIDKKNSFISAADNCLQQVSLINNKFSELKSKYSEIYEKSDYCHDVKKYFKSITELIENSKESIKDVYVYAAMANNDTHIQLKELNLKLEIINLELKPLMGISKPECNFNNTNFVDFITPSAEDIFKRIL